MPGCLNLPIRHLILFFSDVFLWNDFANAQRGYCSWVKRFSTSWTHLIWCWWVSNGYRCVLFATSFCDEDTKKRSCTAYTSLHVVYKSSGSRTNSIQDASLAPSTPTQWWNHFDANLVAMENEALPWKNAPRGPRRHKEHNNLIKCKSIHACLVQK